MKSWTALASKSKSLAQMNKSSDVDKATKKYSALRDASRAERAEFYFDPFCQLAPAATRLGLLPSQRGTDPNNRQFQVTLHFLDNRRSVK
jgi:hypothetical protein